MNLQTIIDNDRSLIALEARLGPVLEPSMREALAYAVRLSGEARHFAVCWKDAEEAGKGRHCLGMASTPAEGALQHRQACIDRLVQVVRPD